MKYIICSFFYNFSCNQGSTFVKNNLKFINMENCKKTLLVFFLVLGHFIVNAQSDKGNTFLAEAKKEIAASNATYFIAIAKNDGSILNHYADDACLLPPNSPVLCSHAEMAKFFKDGYEKYGLKGGKFITKNIYGDGREYVTEEGLWQSFDAHGKVFDDGKFLVLWKKTKNGWKMFRDSFSSNRTQK
jgi:ketosteroid isomerase-like protein